MCFIRSLRQNGDNYEQTKERDRHHVYHRFYMIWQNSLKSFLVFESFLNFFLWNESFCKYRDDPRKTLFGMHRWWNHWWSYVWEFKGLLFYSLFYSLFYPFNRFHWRCLRLKGPFKFQSPCLPCHQMKRKSKITYSSHWKLASKMSRKPISTM